MSSPTALPNPAPIAIVGVKTPTGSGRVMAVTQPMKIVNEYNRHAFLSKNK
jgi:hypothetical protein